jgi:DNA-binding transcriptional MerR regulator
MTAKFNDGKDDGALRTIGEVSLALGIKTHVLRYWEQQFPALQPLKRSGRRYYRTEDVGLLEMIDHLVNRDGYTLKGAQQALKDGKTVASSGLAPEPMVAKLTTDTLDEVPADVIAQLRAIRAQLAAALT